MGKVEGLGNAVAGFRGSGRKNSTMAGPQLSNPAQP